MNCEQVSSVLDAHAPEALTLRQRQDVDRHFASCCECRAAWAAYRELAAETVPATSRGLARRIAAALAAYGPVRARTLRRSFALGAALAVGVAAAATIALQLQDRALVQSGDEPPTRAGPAVPAEPRSAPVAAVPAVSGADGANARRDAAPSGAQFPLDSYSIVVLAAADPAADARAAAIFAECQTEVVRALRALAGLNVIAGERVSSYAGTGLAPEEIARELGAGSVLVLATAPQALVDRGVAVRAELGLASQYGSCRAQQLDAQSGAERASALQLHPEWSADTTREFAADIAEKVREAVLENAATLIAAARATVLDTSLGERERTTALAKLRQGIAFTEPLSPSGTDGATFRAPLPLVGLRALPEPIPGAYDEATVAAVVQIGLTSSDARARQAAWNGLRGVRDSQAAQALATSLANDTDENVRRAAALALGYLVDEPGVRDALARAAAQDPSESAPVPCCIPSVRDAARRALSSDAQLRESALRTVLDETLTGEERVRPLHQSLDGRAFPVQLSDEAAKAVFAIGRDADDPIVRARAWEALAAVRNPAFMRTLAEDLAGHSAENVRTAAAAALRPYRDDPFVRAALERARGDALRSVQRAAQAALDGVEAAERQ